MYRIVLGILFASALVVAITQAQEDNNYGTESFGNYLRSGNQLGLGIKTLGLFDRSRMTFSHSITSSYTAFGGEGVMRNLFMETIGYRISEPLTLTLNLGFLNQPYSTYQQSDFFESGAFIGSASLTWRPKDNMFLRVEFGNLPKYSRYGYYPYSYLMPRYYTPIETNWIDNGPESTGLHGEE